MSVCPSGAARAARAVPIVPFAPPTFSMIIGWPSDSRIGSGKKRPTVSPGPPGRGGDHDGDRGGWIVLRVCHYGPRRRPAEQCDEIAPPHEDLPSCRALGPAKRLRRQSGG